MSHGNTDMPALLNNLAREELLDRLHSIVDGFTDSLHYFQVGIVANVMVSPSASLLLAPSF